MHADDLAILSGTFIIPKFSYGMCLNIFGKKSREKKKRKGLKYIKNIYTDWVEKGHRDILSWTVCVESSCFLTPVGASLPLLVLSVFLLTIRVSRRQVALVQQRGLRQSRRRRPG